jgi:RNA polymerase sigma-70 factor (ECF subfamily)
MSRETDSSEPALIRAAQEDSSRFGDLYEMHVDHVYAFIARRVRDRDLAQDLTSDVFHRALAFLPRYEWRGAPFGAWLLRIAANVVADRGKQADRERPLSDPEHLPDPDKASLEDSERRAQLFRLVAGLPADQQRVVRLRFTEDRTIKEIASELGRTEGAVKQLQFRALKSLRARLDESDG